MGRQRGEGQRRAGARQGTSENMALATQVRELRELVERQQVQLAAQQEQIAALQARSTRADRQESTPVEQAARTTRRNHHQSSVTSRRQLLQGAGTAAAAATVALVASQQGAHAAPAADGGSLLLGNGANANNTATTLTTMTGIGTYADMPAVLLVDASLTDASQGLVAQGPGGGIVGIDSGSFGAAGVTGSSASAYGVVGQSSAIADIFAGGTGRLRLLTQSFTGAPTSGNYFLGEMIIDANGDLWVCDGSGMPGAWYRAAHTIPGLSGGVTNYLTKPIRLLDTRGSDPNALNNGGGPISGGPPYTLQVADVNWMSVQVPGNAVGAVGKLTVISYPSGSGFVALVPSGSGSPTTGTLPYGASQTLATGINVGLGGSPGSIDIYVGGTPVDVVIDLFAVVA